MGFQDLQDKSDRCKKRQMRLVDSGGGKKTEGLRVFYCYFIRMRHLKTGHSNRSHGKLFKGFGAGRDQLDRCLKATVLTCWSYTVVRTGSWGKERFRAQKHLNHGLIFKKIWNFAFLFLFWIRSDERILEKIGDDRDFISIIRRKKLKFSYKRRKTPRKGN